MKKILNSTEKSDNNRAVIQIFGDGKLVAEDCGSIKTYDSDRIVFKSKSCVEVNGEKLKMTYLGYGAVSISGKISAIKFGE
ncbi:MAG: YabP/YqfC family sporulation protein [Clostridia bacterium]|nr:YabP/YqfC family sporulation protein [Clostridia bacterium]